MIETGPSGTDQYTCPLGSKKLISEEPNITITVLEVGCDDEVH